MTEIEALTQRVHRLEQAVSQLLSGVEADHALSAEMLERMEVLCSAVEAMAQRATHGRNDA